MSYSPVNRPRSGQPGARRQPEIKAIAVPASDQASARRNWMLLALVTAVMIMGTLSAGQVRAEQVDPNFAEGSEQLRAQLAESLPEFPVEGIYPTELESFFYVEMSNGQTLYGSRDGQYIFSGDLFRISNGLLNLAEARRSKKRVELLAQQPVENMVVFSPEGETRTHVTVFTDVDCGYCRKLHQEMDEINALGIEVRYVAFPRQGFGTPTYNKIVSAWCSEDPNKAMTALKAGLSIPDAKCSNPVDAQYELGQKVGVTGTPAIVTADGRLLPGYMPADRLAQAVGLTAGE